jgi:glycosyltransferase involved in cell wall biosynthesis
MSLVIALDVRCIGQQQTGDTTYWTGLLEGLAQLQTDARFLLYSNQPKPNSVPTDPRFIWITLNSKRNRWWSLFRFPLAARRAGANVIHVQYNLSPLITKGGVTTVHDLSFFNEPDWFRPQDRLLLQRFVPPSTRRAEKVITVSEFSKREIARYIPDVAHKTVVAHNACPKNIQTISQDTARELLRENLGIEQPYLLTVGTRWPRKNMNLAIQAANLLPNELPHKLIVTGKAGWGEEPENSRTQFTGFVSNELLCALYACADLYLAPSLYEGFGITLLEAFRMGTPVIGSGIEAHKEVGENAFHSVESFEPQVWAESITKLLQNPEQRKLLKELGIAREQNFSWKKAAEIHLKTYQESHR